MRPQQTVLVLGAGLTGLSMAFRLSQQGYGVTLLDHPDWKDGFQTNACDPAPILFGCYRESWHLLRTLHTHALSEAGTPLSLEFRMPDGRIVPYQSSHLPGALQWMMSLFNFRGLDWHDRWKLFSHLEQIWEEAQLLPADLHSRLAGDWLTSIGQSKEACQHVWAPLAQWLTGNALTRLSASTFVQLLSDIFLGQALDARLTSLRGSVADTLITPLHNALHQLGALVQPHTDLPRLRFEHNRLHGVYLGSTGLLQADWYVAALPHWKLLALLPERLLTRYAYFAHIQELRLLPEIAVELASSSIPLAPRLILLAGRPFHQLLIRPSSPKEVRFRLSATDNQSLAGLDDAELIALASRELRLHHPAIEAETLQSIQIYREEQAALSLTPGTALLRPIQKSPIPKFLIAGAWTDTGWPANIESALVSARRCADIITNGPCDNQH